MCDADVRTIRADLARQRLVDVCDEIFDWSILLAARVALAASREKPVDELVAVAGPAINAVAGLRTHQVVHVSSGSVYETLTGRLSPELRLAPRLPYAVAKLAAEHLVASYSVAPVSTVRFFGAYGPGEPSFKVTRRMVDAFRRGDSAFSITGDGSNRIDPMHVEDAAKSLLRLATLADSRVMDLSQGESKTMKEYAHCIYEAVHPDPLGVPLRLRLEGEAHEQMRGMPDPSRADSILKVERRSLLQGMQDYARYLASLE
jgi:nucleoside-diphosphate-sugar epimerase